METDSECLSRYTYWILQADFKAAIIYMIKELQENMIRELKEN